MGRIEAHRACLFAPALGLEPLPGQTAIQQRANREDVRPLVHTLATINFGRGIAIVEYRFALKLVIVADIVQAQQLDTSVRAISDRLGAYIVQTERAAVEKRNRLADLDGDTYRLALAHLETAAALRERDEFLVGINEINPPIVGESTGGALECGMIDRERQREHASEQVTQIVVRRFFGRRACCRRRGR